jgi:hypothetical protein
MQAHTTTEVIRAIDQMVRMKATEEAPDVKGQRQIWHHSDGGGELVTLVDKTGRVLRQEFTLFDDFVLWQPGARIRTGTMPAREDRRSVPSATKVTFDAAPNRDRIERLREAFDGYAGDEPYVVHIKRLIDSTRHSGFPAASIVTRALVDVRGGKKKKKGGVSPAVLIIAGLALLGLIALVISRHA